MTKRCRLAALLLGMLLLLTACTDRAAVKNSILSMYTQNEQAFTDAAASGNFSALSGLKGVEKVYQTKEYVDIYCYGTGIAPSSSTFGIFYSAADNLWVGYGLPQEGELVPEGNGYRYRQPDGDNQYYVEPLGNHYFYYEASF